DSSKADRGGARSRYRFGAFTLSPARRTLTRDGKEIPLIPRYFDLLILLLERRQEAVTRGEIFDVVWRDVGVSDAALSQAGRTLRRGVGDDPREPVFIRTVARHGYSFVASDVVEEKDDGSAAAVVGHPPAAAHPIATESAPGAGDDRFETEISKLLAPAAG